MEDITYIEPFVGGGAMLFFMLQRYPNIKKAFANDINPNLIKAYQTVKYFPEKLILSLQLIEKEFINITEYEDRKAFFLKIRKRFNVGGLSDLDNTTYFIFLNKTCFNGLYRVNSKGLFNVPFGKYANPTICDANTIYADSRILQKVELTNEDFEETEAYVTDNTFAYFDPPYRPLDATSSFNSYSKEAFNDLEQIRLKHYIDHLTSKKCLIMLSNSDCRGRNPNDLFFDNLYANYDINRVYATRSVNSNPNKRGKLTELLIRNYKTAELCSAAIGDLKFFTNIKANNHEEGAYKRTV